MLSFGERRKPEYPGGETSKSTLENQQTQPSYHAESGNRTWATWVDTGDNRTQRIILYNGILLETFILQVKTEFGDMKTRRQNTRARERRGGHAREPKRRNFEVELPTSLKIPKERIVVVLRRTVYVVTKGYKGYS